MTTETNPRKTATRIWVTDDNYRQLQNEFDVTGSHIRNSLKFYSDSELAKKIRTRAIEMMAETQERNRELIKEQDQD